MKRVLSGEGKGGRERRERKRERGREAACTFDWKNSSNQEASRLSIPKDRGSHVREPERASTRVSVEYRVEKGAPPLSRFEACSRRSRPPPRFSPYGPHRSSHALSPLPRIPPVITPLLRRATKMAAPPVHPTVRLSPIPFFARLHPLLSLRAINKRFSSLVVIIIIIIIPTGKNNRRKLKICLVKISRLEMDESWIRSKRLYTRFGRHCVLEK